MAPQFIFIKGFPHARTVPVNGLGNQFFSSSRLACDEDGCRGRGDFADGFQKPASLFPQNRLYRSGSFRDGEKACLSFIEPVAF